MISPDKMSAYDCLIVGAGPIALAMACALEHRGLSYTVCGELPLERPNSPDLRTAALFDGSIRFLKNLGVWTHIKPHATPLAAIRIIDATGRLLRAPEQLFTAADIREAELGYNIPNPALVQAFRMHLGATADHTETNLGEINLTAKVTKVDTHKDHVTAVLADGTTRSARIAIAADGRNSITRAAASISTQAWSHDQAAVTAHFRHEFSNEGISTEIHTPHGPCTTVPLDTHQSSLVWIVQPETAAQLADLTETEFAAALECRLQGLLGPVRETTIRRVFPLSSLVADRFADRRIALVGESAHVFPPIGAQGLNLGLRDVASLIDNLVEAQHAQHDLGDDKVLAAYSKSRQADILARTYGVDAFNTSLAGGAANLVRGAAFHAISASPGIKRFLMERGLQPIGPWPNLMRE